MKIRNVQIRDFRCIEDSGEFSITDITCLVGKNESGKTTVLAALEKLNPVSTERGSFTSLDYPRRKWRPDEKVPIEPAALTTKWTFSDQELQEFEATFGKGTLRKNEITISKSYDNLLRISIDIDESALVNGLLDGIGLTSQDRAVLGLTQDTFAELQSNATKLAQPTEGHAKLVARMQKDLPNGLNSIDDKVKEWLPIFLYFGEYQKLEGQVSLTAFLQRKASNQNTWGDLLFTALLSLAGTTPENVNSLARFEDLNASLRAVSNQISEEIFAYWSQNKHLDVILRFDYSRPSDPPPFNEGFVFRTRIDNRRHRSDTSFDDRSSGFVWFFSFLVWFSQLRKKYGSKLVVLLDEPGLTLHARAQADLLRYMEERIKPNHQVLYTTHSPFMIDPDNILSARTVEDVVAKDGSILGTKVGDRVLSIDPDTISPLQRALDYEMTQTLFIGRHTLLVEGSSDLAYLKWFSNQLKKKNRTSLDYRWTICVVGGADRIPGFTSLFRGNGLQIAALVDYANGMKQRIQNAKAVLGDKRVLTADTYAGQPEADIEDILGKEFYVALVNKAYRLIGSDMFISPATGRLIKHVEDHFRILPSTYDEFDHYKPAGWLFEANDEGAALPGIDGALDRMEKVIRDLNALVPA